MFHGSGRTLVIHGRRCNIMYFEVLYMSSSSHVFQIILNVIPHCRNYVKVRRGSVCFEIKSVMDVLH